MSDSDRPASSPETPADTQSLSTAGVARLVRRHNLLILAVFIVGLGGLAMAQTHGSRIERGGLYEILIAARIAVLIISLILTAVITNRSMRGVADACGSRAVSIDAAAPAFGRCKTLSMVLLTICGLFAGACLILTSRKIDLILAIAALLLLMITRPSESSLEQFAAMAENTREESIDPGDDGARRQDDA